MTRKFYGEIFCQPLIILLIIAITLVRGCRFFHLNKIDILPVNYRIEKTPIFVYFLVAKPLQYEIVPIVPNLILMEKL